MSFSAFAFHSLCRDAELAQVDQHLNSLHNIDIVQYLLRRDDDERTPVHHAAANYPVLAALLARCKDQVNDVIDTVDDTNWTPLMTAASSGCLLSVREFLRLCADRAVLVNRVNDVKNSALHYAASKGHVQIAQELIAAGSKKNAKNKLGQTPLLRAVSSGKIDMVDALLACGAATDRCDGQGNNVLQVAAVAVQKPMLLHLLAIRSDLECDVSDKNRADKTLADLVGGQDLLDKLIARSEQEEEENDDDKNNNNSKE